MGFEEWWLTHVREVPLNAGPDLVKQIAGAAFLSGIVEGTGDVLRKLEVEDGKG